MSEAVDESQNHPDGILQLHPSDLRNLLIFREDVMRTEDMSLRQLHRLNFLLLNYHKVHHSAQRRLCRIPGRPIRGGVQHQATPPLLLLRAEPERERSS